MTEHFEARNPLDVSLVARAAPFGNKFTSPVDVCIRAGRLVYFDIDSNDEAQHYNNSDPFFNCNTSSDFNSDSDHINSDMDDSKYYNNNKVVLPNIAQRSPNGSTNDSPLKELFIKNGNISIAEEQDLVKDLMVSLQFMDVQRLSSLQTEISDYDPYERGIVDASSLQRILAKFFKLIPLSSHSLQKLFQLFATDPKRPRLIQYVQMMQYLNAVKTYMTQNSNDEAVMAKMTNAHLAGSSMAQSPLYKRGDAKLILELQKALNSAKIESVDVESIRQALNILDRGHGGTLNREQIENVLKSFHLYTPLTQVLPLLFQRCNLSNDDQHDWGTIVRFLEKAQPSSYQDKVVPVNQSKTRRDMMSSFDSSSQINGSSTHLPPLMNTFHVQQNGVSAQRQSQPQSYNEDPKKLLEETEMQMQALMIRRQQLEQEMQNKKKQAEKKSEVVKVDNRPRSASKLIEQLRKLDTSNSGFASLANARKVIQQYNDLHELGLNSKMLQNVLTICANENETHVNLQQLSTYLSNALKS